MKKLFASIFTSKNILQLILAVFAFITFNYCEEIGTKSFSKEEQSGGLDFNREGDIIEKAGTGVAITSQSGFNGGALGMGVICASCVMGIVFIETSKKRHNVV